MIIAYHSIGFTLLFVVASLSVASWPCDAIGDLDGEHETKEVAMELLQYDILVDQKTLFAENARYSASDALTILPSIDCVRMITLNGSEMSDLLRNELKVRGLWNRTTVQTEQLDPEGGRAGCFRAHVRAWNLGLTLECENLLVLEDDVFF
jgi:hypothetical protein